LTTPWQLWLKWGSKTPKSVKSEVKKGRQQEPPEKSWMFPIIWKSWRNGQISRYFSPSKTEPREY
jgi:hypothetical protein